MIQFFCVHKDAEEIRINQFMMHKGAANTLFLLSGVHFIKWCTLIEFLKNSVHIELLKQLILQSKIHKN